MPTESDPSVNKTYKLPEAPDHAGHSEGVTDPQGGPITPEEMSQKAKILQNENAITGIPPVGHRDSDIRKSGYAPYSERVTGARSHKRLIGGLALGLAGAIAATGAYLGLSHKGDGKPEANPTGASGPAVPGQTGETTTTPTETVPSIDAAKIMSTSTYHTYIAEHPSDKEALAEYVVSRVDIPSTAWDTLPLADRATRTAQYVEWGVEKAFDENLIGQSPLEAQSHLNDVKWNPYITESMLSSSVKGNLADLQKVETIREMYEGSIGLALNANGIYTQQIKDNLTNTKTGFISQPSNAIINRADYAAAGLNSALNVNTLSQYGGTVNTLPNPDKTLFPFDGITVSTPDSAAWFRPPGLNDTNFFVIPIKTTDDKYIPFFGYSEDVG